VNLEEDDPHDYLHLDVPGLACDDIKGAVVSETLIVRGEKRKQRDSNERRTHTHERYVDRFYRTLSLPMGSDRDQRSATLGQRVLTITLPKIASSGRRAIPTQSIA